MHKLNVPLLRTVTKENVLRLKKTQFTGETFVLLEKVTETCLPHL